MTSNKAPFYERVVFFDGICHLCNGFVDFAIQNENPRTKLYFAPLQGETAKATLSSEDQASLQSVIYFENGVIHRESKAILEILRSLRAPWSWIALMGFIIPEGLRNRIYQWVAKNRYAWFGQRQSCRLPLPGEKSQLLP